MAMRERGAAALKPASGDADTDTAVTVVMVLIIIGAVGAVGWFLTL